MTDYEAEHNLPSHSASAIASAPRRRPSLSTFYSSLRALETSSGSDTAPSSASSAAPGNRNAQPLPVNVEASFVLLAEALTAQQLSAGPAQDSDAIAAMLEHLRSQAADPPAQVEGVSDAFLDGLERVERRRLAGLRGGGEDGSGAASCPICGETFVSDPYPLVVRLPCHKDHVFDYECIRPWLKLNPTCPLDRKVLVKKKVVPPPKAVDDDEDYDDYFA